MIRRIKRSLRVRLLKLLGEPESIELPALPPDELAELKTHFNLPKFFAMGYPRSGTTLLARLLRQSPEISCRWQGHFASRPGDWLDRFGHPGMAEWLALGSNRWVGDDGPSLTGLARVSADFVMERVAHLEGSSWVGDKTPTPRMDQALERLHRLYPDASVLAIVRDGRDAALSQRIQAFIDQPETLSPMDARLRQAIERSPDQFGPAGRSIFSVDWLERVARNWASSVGDGHRLAEQLYGPRYYSVRYEDLVEEPLLHMKAAFRFLGVSLDQSLDSSLRAAFERNPAAEWHRQTAPELSRLLTRGTAGGWQQWFTEQDTELFNSHAGEELAEWGYDRLS